MASKPYPNVNVWVGPNQQYTTLSASLADNAQDLTGNGPFVIGIREAFEESGNNDLPSPEGWTTTPDDYLHIWVHPDVRHKGFWNDDAVDCYRRTAQGSQSNPMGQFDDVSTLTGFKIEGVAIRFNNLNPGGRTLLGIGVGSGINAGKFTVDSCLFVAHQPTASLIAIGTSGTSAPGKFFINNCMFLGPFGSTTNQASIFGSQAASGAPYAYIYNCTFIDNIDSVRVGDRHVFKNCLFVNSNPNNGNYSSSGSVDSQNNIYSIESAVGITGSNNVVLTGYPISSTPSKTGSYYDGRLEVGVNDHLRVGANLRTDSENPIYFDILGTNRDDGKPNYVGAHHPQQKGFREFPVDETSMERKYRGRR